MYNKINIMEESIKLYKTRNMCTFVKMEYLVASALVELYEKENITKISLDDIRAYGIKVEEHLINNNINAIFLYSNNYTKQFLHDYSDFFERIDNDIVIKEGVTVESIRDHILSYLSIDMLFALLNESTLTAIKK